MDFHYLLPDGRTLTTGKLRGKWTTSVSVRSSLSYINVDSIPSPQTIVLIGNSEEGITETKRLEFFLNGTELSLNSTNSAKSGNLISHRSMNWAQFKDPVLLVL